MSEIDKPDGRDFVNPLKDDGKTGLETTRADSVDSAGNNDMSPLYGWVNKSTIPPVSLPAVGGEHYAYWFDSDDTLPPEQL